MSWFSGRGATRPTCCDIPFRIVYERQALADWRPSTAQLASILHKPFFEL